MENLAITAAIWYNFNILAITGIVFFMLKIALNRSKQIVINNGSERAAQKNMPPFLRFVAGLSVLAIIFFAVREWGDDLYGLTEPLRDFIGEKIDS